MRPRILVGAVFAGLAVGSVVVFRGADPAIKWAAVNLTKPMSVAEALLSGPVIFVHDDVKMTRGELCTTVYRFVLGRGAGEELVAFHCRPRSGEAPAQFTASTTREPGGSPVRTEYLFAGDREAHGVPARAFTH